MTIISFWDILPLEIMDYILFLKEQIIREERKTLISGLTDDELYNELLNRVNDRDKRIIKGNDNVILINRFSYNDFYDVLNLGMNMNRTTSIINAETCQTVIHYDQLSFEEQYNCVKENINALSITDYNNLLQNDFDYVRLADMFYEYWRARWHYP